MKKCPLLFIILAVAAIISLTSLNAVASDAEYVPGEVLVKFKEGTEKIKINNLNGTLGVSQKREFKRYKIHQIKLPSGMAVEEAVRKYKEDPNVEYAEPNYIVHTLGLPDDPSFNQLWGLNNTGQSGGTADADIDAPEAWDIETGKSNDIIIAVVDTGVAYNHPDLINNRWVNTIELNGQDGVDDDNNGYVDDKYGWDFVDWDGEPLDLNEHGTHVAGTIAAEGDNSTGVAGVMWNAKIMPVRFLGLSGSGSTTDAILAIEYAVKNGAKIINNSWGGGSPSTPLKEVIEESDALFIFAAGNASRDNDTSPMYPASFDSPNIISVAATDYDDNLAWFSSFGATSVDLGAPGVSIYSTIPQYNDINPVDIHTLDFEGGAGTLPTFGNTPLIGWSKDSGSKSTWAITSGGECISNCLQDSPPDGTDYQTITRSTAGFMTPVDSTAPSKRYTLAFDWKGDLEQSYDFMDIKYTDASGGNCNNSNWDWIDYRPNLSNPIHNSFATDYVDFTPVAETYDSFCFGFGMDSDNSNNRDGVYIDNVIMTIRDIIISGYSYDSFNGTSMATPHVSGVAGLILAVNPNLTSLQVKEIILNNVDVIAGLKGKVLTNGRLNAFKAVQEALTTVGTDGGGSGGGGGGCFIATAAYGSPLHPYVKRLKKFRDDHLLTNKPGQAFVELYYKYSPPLADAIDKRPALKTLTRIFLYPLVMIILYPAVSGSIILTCLLLLTVLMGGKRREYLS